MPSPRLTALLREFASRQQGVGGADSQVWVPREAGGQWDPGRFDYGAGELPPPVTDYQPPASRLSGNDYGTDNAPVRETGTGSHDNFSLADLPGNIGDAFLTYTPIGRLLATLGHAVSGTLGKHDGASWRPPIWRLAGKVGGLFKGGERPIPRNPDNAVTLTDENGQIIGGQEDAIPAPDQGVTLTPIGRTIGRIPGFAGGSFESGLDPGRSMGGGMFDITSVGGLLGARDLLSSFYGWGGSGGGGSGLGPLKSKPVLTY